MRDKGVELREHPWNPFTLLHQTMETQETANTGRTQWPGPPLWREWTIDIVAASFNLMEWRRNGRKKEIRNGARTATHKVDSGRERLLSKCIKWVDGRRVFSL